MYKRQIRNGAAAWWFYVLIGVACLVIFRASSNQAGHYSSYGAYYYAVSYTHLDVYKRQMLNCAKAAWELPDGSFKAGKKFLHVSTDEVYGSLPVSYTHLVIGYFLLASRMSPYLVDRYVMPLFPLAALLLALLLCYLRCV